MIHILGIILLIMIVGRVLAYMLTGNSKNPEIQQARMEMRAKATISKEMSKVAVLCVLIVGCTFIPFLVLLWAIAGLKQ
jgi:uncharacterized protein involved in cysteine biosynthesis